MWLVFHTMKIKFLHKNEHQQFINTVINNNNPPPTLGEYLAWLDIWADEFIKS